MFVQGSGGAGFFSGIRFRLGSQPAGLTGPSAASGPGLRDFASSLVALSDATRKLDLAGRYSRTNGIRSPAALSTNKVALSSLVDSPTRLRSTEEVNTIPTSYSTTRPAFQGSSSSQASLSGIYSGSNGDTTLTFRATVGGSVGFGLIRFEVRNGQDQVVETFNLSLFEPANTPHTLSNGLTVRFSSGSIQTGDRFTVDVSASEGTAVRPDNAFNGTGDGAAFLDPGESVSTGVLQINGVSIAVNASDSLNAVLARITASAADVTASFDEDTESVVLERKTPGAQAITLGSDTSGFFSATKLVGAVQEPGTLDDRLVAIDAVAELAGIQSGTFTVNGVSIAIDTAVDSITDVIERLNAANAGASARYDARRGTLTILSTTPASLVLSDDTTGLFATFGIDEGTFAVKQTQGGARFRDTSALRVAIAKFVDAYAAVFEADFTGSAVGSVAGARGRLRGAAEGAFHQALGRSGTGRLRSGLGLDLAATDDGRTLRLDRGRFLDATRRDAGELIDLLFGARGEEGLVPALREALDGALERIEQELGDEGLGLRLDVFG